jgi:hypothetical protein
MHSRQLFIIILLAIALTVIGPSLIQQAMAVGNSSSVGNPTQLPLGSHTPCPNKTNSTASNSSSGTASNSSSGTASNSSSGTASNSSSGTASNSSHIVKSDLLFSGNKIVRIASNNPMLEPISSRQPCGNGGVVIVDGSVY